MYIRHFVHIEIYDITTTAKMVYQREIVTLLTTTDATKTIVPCTRTSDINALGCLNGGQCVIVGITHLARMCKFVIIYLIYI